MRPRKARSACFTCGSLTAIIELMAQMGLVSTHSRSNIHKTIVETKILTAKWTPSQSPRRCVGMKDYCNSVLARFHFPITCSAFSSGALEILMKPSTGRFSS